MTDLETDDAASVDTAADITLDTKPIWQSKTLVVNAIAGALVAMEANLGVLQPLLPVNFYAAMAVALPVINSLLRMATTRGVRW